MIEIGFNRVKGFQVGFDYYPLPFWKMFAFNLGLFQFSIVIDTLRQK